MIKQPIGVLALATSCLLIFPLSGQAQERVALALGGDIVACTGAIEWTPETEGESSRVEPMRLATPKAPSDARIALFQSDDDFVEEDVWTCAEGFCTSHRVTRVAVTLAVLRLLPAQSQDGTQHAYRLDATFTAVAVEDGALRPFSTAGLGEFLCDALLPPSVVAPAAP